MLKNARIAFILKPYQNIREGLEGEGMSIANKNKIASNIFAIGPASAILPVFSRPIVLAIKTTPGMTKRKPVNDIASAIASIQ